MNISVIIPTHNRKKALKKCLTALNEVSYPVTDFEVIIVDDGSTDGTNLIKDSLNKNYHFSAKYIYQQQAGPAKARNQAIKTAKGKVLIIIGDDIIVTNSFINEHLSCHQKSESNIALIGRTNWYPKLQITDFMRYLENGIQFAFNELTNQNVSYKHCYTSNISIKKSFITENSVFFLEQFPYAAYEDIEWGYRLMQHGIKFKYNEKALAYHNHPVTLNEYSKRMTNAGKACAYLCKIHPEIEFNKNKTQSLYKIIEKSFKAFYMERILQNKHLLTLFKPFINEQKWTKKILAHYEEQGFREENAKIK